MVVKKILKYLAIFFGVVIILWCIVVGLILTPEVLTPQVVGVMQKYTKSEVSIKSVDLSLFTRFPNVTLRIDSLRIAQTNDSISDLIFARECRVSVNPVALLSKNLTINRVSLLDASIYVYVDSLHGPIKTFILPDSTSEQEDTTSSTDLSGYSLTLRRLKIDSTQIVIDDRTREFYTRVDDFAVDMSMNLSSRISDLEIATGFSNLIVWTQGDLLVKKTAMELRSTMSIDRDAMQISFDRARVMLNNIDLRASGLLERDTIAGGIQVDIQSSLNTPSLSEFLALIPSSVIDGKDEITTQGEVLFDIDIKGLYSDNSYPTMGATLKIDNAQAKYASRKLALEEVDCDAYMFVDLNSPKNSYADIKSLKINTSDIIDLTVNGKVTNIIDDPEVDMSVVSSFNFDRFSEVFPLDQGIVCSGVNNSNIQTKFKMSDMQNSNYADLYIEGESMFQNLDISFDASKFAQDSSSLAYLHMQAEKGRMLFGDNVMADKNSRTLRSKVDFQDLSYMSKTGEYMSIQDIELTAGANFDRVTSAVNGIGIRGVAKNAEVGVDSLFSSKLESSEIVLIVKPKTEERGAVINATISSQQIAANEPNYNSNIALSTVDMNFTMERVAPPVEAQQSQDSTSREQGGGQNQRGQSQQMGQREGGQAQQMRQTEGGQAQQGSQREGGQAQQMRQTEGGQAQDSVVRQRSGSPGYGSQGPQIQTVRQPWTMQGTMAFSDFAMFSDLFPIDVKIPNTSISIGQQSISLDNARLTIGNSEMVATGSIQNLIRKFFIDSRAAISGDLAVHASVLDIGQLMEASNRSVLMLEDQADSLSVDSLGMAVVADTSSAMFIVPRRVSFAFDLNIDKAIIGEGTVENLAGRASIKDGVLSLEELSLDAIGAKATGSVIYRNIDQQSSNVAADMTIAGIDINRIGELMPSINAMLPMLESFEGIVDFDIKANTNLDSNSEIDISTLFSSMRFKGKNLVLMDSETFTDLSKTLMFKNKDRNLIDSVEMYALVSESTIDVLPFSMSIDRYSAIIGGSQVVDPKTFDLEYDYNVSIIKSPLPFKAGVDIVGNLEDFDFKVTKAKLKKTDFDQQRAIYEEFTASIDISAAELVEELDAKRLEMQAQRRAQRIEQQRQAAKEEAEIDAEEAESEDAQTAESEGADTEESELADTEDIEQEEPAVELSQAQQADSLNTELPKDTTASTVS
ncbi:MAG: AsmA-like C-terminal region-containing protein [Rikenellaceae bacterium]